MRRIWIQPDDFDVGAECKALSAGNLATGAIVAFTGLVRGENNLSSLTLEHYPGMTEREIARHVDEAERRWSLMGVTILHRNGSLRPGEQIVLVAVASARRKAAFEAAEFLMDYLKTRAPFWKQEQRGDVTEWVEAKKTDETATAKWRSP